MNYIKNVGDNQNKFGDTATVFQLGLMKDDEVYNFGDNQVTVNIANETGYVLSVTPDKSSQNTVLDLDFNKVPLKNLTPDSYRLEVEVKSTDGDIAKFPTSGAMTFSINHDLKETSGELVPTVTFDNVLAAVDEKIAVYMDTVKVGPQGPQGPAGNVDTSNNNTFTGANKFTQLIDGALKTRPATFTDFAQVANDMISYAGFWVVDNKSITGAPDGLLNYIVEVIPGSWSGNGIIFISSYTTEEEYVARVDGQLKIWFKLSNDGKVVHNTGTETIAGDKTFTGNNTFTNLINGSLSTRPATFTDFADVAKNMFKYAGNWYVMDQTIANDPAVSTGGLHWYHVIVNPAYGSNTGNIQIESISGTTYNTGVDAGVLKGWNLIPKDSKLVHNTGTETINGDKTFRSGNYGLRVTTAGIQKTSDNGVTWTNI